VRIVFLAFFVLVSFSGCATKVSQSNLYWGNYSNTLYKVKKEPSEATSLAHEQELQSIVEKSKEMNLKVPPGIYAELGLYAMERADNNAAQNYFRLEQESYPEGAILMQHTLKDKPSKS
jgi:hypothetical protein